MELLPVLEPLDEPRDAVWYAVVPAGNGPGESVGHTCTFLPSQEGGRGRILVVGGADPSGSFSHSYVINLDNHEWVRLACGGLTARYEHCSFVPESRPQSLWVFGGAQQTSNRNCIQELHMTDTEPRWRTVAATGTPPSPRTYHSSSAGVGDRLYVFSGGEAGAAPVQDSRLHVFDTASSSWSQPATQGRRPAARQGHVVAAVGSRIYVHGGMTGDKFFNDMHSLDSRTMKWRKVQTRGDVPPGVASHAAVVKDKHIYIFGGMTTDGAANLMYRFDPDTNIWVLLRFTGALPASRLDHSMCLVPWRPSGETETRAEASETETETRAGRPEASQTETRHLAFVFGGMDTRGNVHHDCVVTVVK
ncbi:rab9 effector protein with kelch motifs-like isoform X1 [Cololabis saira]|uniref:rab9 effector protein with kelch motifs-like isoform X1 n=1 Tax=Cololabis saira TaxID=129043 RepID=UPI002AD549A4|nr:rab9 effector protein with kelch motifs-like isoform X1 [Cololabis saira]